MKRASVLAVVVAGVLTACLVGAQERGRVPADPVHSESQVATPAQPSPAPALETLAGSDALVCDASAPPPKKCGFNSDCPYGKCSSGKCGGCGFDSDCKGFGKCKSGWCGACGFDSECKGFGKCSGGKCTEPPY